MTTDITTPVAIKTRYFHTKRERKAAKRQIAQYRKQGMKHKAIAALMGIPVSTVVHHANHPVPVKHRVAKKEGWTRVATDPAQVEQIQDLWESGKSAPAIAKTVGVSLSTVHRNKNRTEAPAIVRKETDDRDMLIMLVPIARAVFRSPAITAEQVTAFLTMAFLAAQNT